MYRVCVLLLAVFFSVIAKGQYDKSLSRPEPGINNVWFNYNKSETVFVFVHGLLSDSRVAWYYDGEEGNAYWPDLIKKDERFGNPSVFLGGFYTDIESGSYSIRDASNELYRSLSVPLDSKKIPLLGKKNILFITHSTGGIVVRHMLVKHKESFKDKVVGLALIASPSVGSKDADRLKYLAELTKNKMGEELRWNNPFLEELDKDFKNLIDKREIKNLVGVEAVENHFILKRLIYFDKKVLVESSSGGRYFGEPFRLADTDHISIVKPSNESHPTYLLLLSFYNSKFLPQVSGFKDNISGVIEKSSGVGRSVFHLHDIDNTSSKIIRGFVSRANRPVGSEYKVKEWIGTWPIIGYLKVKETKDEHYSIGELIDNWNNQDGTILYGVDQSSGSDGFSKLIGLSLGFSGWFAIGRHQNIRSEVLGNEVVLQLDPTSSLYNIDGYDEGEMARYSFLFRRALFEFIVNYSVLLEGVRTNVDLRALRYYFERVSNARNDLERSRGFVNNSEFWEELGVIDEQISRIEDDIINRVN